MPVIIFDNRTTERRFIVIIMFLYIYIQNYNLTTETTIRNLVNGDMGWIAFDLWVCVCVCVCVVCVCVCVCVSVIWWYQSACLALLASLVCLERFLSHTHPQTNINEPKSQIQNSFTPDLTYTRDLKIGQLHIYIRYISVLSRVDQHTKTPHQSTHQDTS